MIPLTPEQENEVREAWNENYPSKYSERLWHDCFTKTEVSYFSLEPIDFHRTAYAIAKGWHKQEGE
ncbi:MAG: hypothetical protein PW734_06845 [Verrucomicrobium sp.]|nr:hypothetical protein [Verrucomicrobium sp.]